MADPEKPRILLVDDDSDLLAGMVRNLRSGHFELITVTSGTDALKMLQYGGPYAVIVSDLKMPGMDGVEVLGRARTIAPDTVRALFTGAPDLDRAVAAINEGAIFRFITKPVSRVMMAIALKSCVEQHQLLTAQRILLEQTLHGAVKALTDVLGLASPLAFGRATRLRRAVRMVAAAAHVADGWQVEVAAMLSQIGCVILPPAVLEKMHQGEGLSEEEERMLHRVPEVVEQILSNIPRLEDVREILRCQDRRFDGSGMTDGMKGDSIPWGSRVLKVVFDLDKLESEGMPLAMACDLLRERAGWYDPAILELLATARRHQEASDVRKLPVSDLRPGMIMAQDVRNKGGVLFVTRGQEVTRGLVEKLKIFAPTLPDAGWVRVIM